MSDEPIKQTTNSAIVGGACGHRVPIAGHTSGRQFQPGKDERLKFRVLQILKNRTPSPAPGTSSPPPSPADPCSCADEQCCWRWTLLAVLSDIWAISHIEPGLVDFSHQSDRSTGSNLPASTAGKVVLGRAMRRRSHPTANYPHRRGAGDAAALQEPQEGLPGSRIARRPSCSPFGPGSRLIRRQRGQIGEVGAAALAHPTGGRARQGVKPHRSERLPTDTDKISI